MLKRCFPPVTDDRTRLLLLGSLPGEASLAAGRYYANPRNQFWRLVGAVVEVDLEAMAYDERLATLLAHRIGLWDTVASATRNGSLDGAIREHEATDLAALTKTLPKLRAIGFNGKKAAAIGSAALEDSANFARIGLPSSSPALTLPFEQKLIEWLRLRDYL